MYDECYAYSCVYIIRLRYLSALAVTNSASVANWSKSRHRVASAEAQTYNSLRGTVLLWDAATERYDVRIRDPPHSGDIIAVKPSKLQVLAE